LFYSIKVGLTEGLIIMKKLISIATPIALMFGVLAYSASSLANQSANTLAEAVDATGVAQNSTPKDDVPASIDVSENNPDSVENTESSDPSDPSEFPESPDLQDSLDMPGSFESSETSESTELSDSAADVEYAEVDLNSLPPSVDLAGEDPEAIAIAIFGNTEPIEGNFQQEVDAQIVNDEAVVNMTQTGLADDSVMGVRYRLKFAKQDEQTWQLVWVGVQQTCYPGRGSQEWTTNACS
jgi:hypothetical protein